MMDKGSSYQRVGLQHATDQEIFDFARKEKRILISADTDFGLLLAQWNKKSPSVIIFRKGAERNPFTQMKLLNMNLVGKVEEALENGSIIIIEKNKLRIKSLPIHE